MNKPKQKIKKKPPQKPVVKGKPKGINPLLILVTILLVTFIVYFKATGFDFVANWDDNVYIFNNPYILSLDWNAVKTIFNPSTFHAGNYHPITTLTYAIEYNVWGLNAKPYHTFNLLIHLLNTLFVFVLLKKLTSKNGLALIVAFLFALHPMHVESVAWIAERKDVLYSLFYLLSLVFYLRYLEKSKWHWLILSFVAFVLSCLSKSMAVTLPVILILIDYWKQRKLSWKWLEKIPFLAVAVIAGLIAIKAQAASGTIYEALPFGWLERFFLICYAMGFYVIKAVFPLNLSVVHFYPNHEIGLSLIHYLSPLVIILMIIAFIYLKKQRRNLVFGFLFLLISLGPVIQIIPVGQFIVAERYTYLPYLGLFYLMGMLINYYYQKKKSRIIVVALSIVFGIFFIFQTSQRINVWKNGVELFTDAIDKNPEQTIVYSTRGNELMRIGQYQRAILDFNKAIEIFPSYADAYHNRGVSKYNLKDYAGAIEDYNRVVELQPKNPNGYYSRGMAKYESEDHIGAIADFDKVVELTGDYMEVFNNRGVSKAKLNRLEESVKDFTRAIKSDKNNANAWFNRGNSLLLLKDFENSCSDYQKAASMGHQGAANMYQQHCGGE